jgi:putative transcriptional regulator
MKSTPTKEIEFSAADVIDAMREGLEMIQAGRVGELRTTVLELPAPVKSIPAKKIKSIRVGMGASQAVFAQMLNVPRATAIAWESGARKPSGAALKLLRIAEKRPDALLA